MKYVPNKFPLKERIWNTFFSAVLIIYGGYGIYTNDLFIPGKRSRGIHLHDEPALIMYAAFICGTLVMLCVVADHYDERNNEKKYQTFSKVFRCLSWGLAVMSLVWTFVRVST